ncbi:MAG: PucR family transcriptional regulator [Solirubrobacteraceae bacterium]
MAAVVSRGEVVRRIIERTDMEQFADRVLDSFWETDEFQKFQPPRDRVRDWVRWNLGLVNRWLTEGRPPTDSELETFRAHARERAAEGIPADVIPANFRRAARFAWGALLYAATDAERPALLDSADLLFEYVDRVSRIYFEESAATAALAGQRGEENAARALLARIDADQAPLPEDHQLADRIGFELARASRAFVIAAPRRSAEYHLELAGQLRRRRALAVSEGRRVVGLAMARSPWHELELDRSAVLAQCGAAIRGERGRNLAELRIAVDVAVGRGHRGEIRADDFFAELLLRRSPRIAGQIKARVYGPLNAELARTLDLLVQNSFERGSTAAALPVHRNTLRDRIHRISEITGVDLNCAQGRGLAWLAWLERRDSSGEPLSG